MRDLKYGKTMVIFAAIGILEAILMVILIFAVKNNVINDLVEIMREDPTIDEKAIDLFKNMINGALVFVSIWGIIMSVTILGLSFFAKKTMGFNIALVALSAFSGLGGISAILLIVFGIMNIIDAARRNKEVGQSDNVSY